MSKEESYSMAGTAKTMEIGNEQTETVHTIKERSRLQKKEIFGDFHQVVGSENHFGASAAKACRIISD